MVCLRIEAYLLGELRAKAARKNLPVSQPGDALPRPGMRCSARSAFANPAASRGRQFLRIRLLSSPFFFSVQISASPFLSSGIWLFFRDA
jgi:hypothetical protein